MRRACGLSLFSGVSSLSEPLWFLGPPLVVTIECFFFIFNAVHLAAFLAIVDRVSSRVVHKDRDEDFPLAV